MTAFTDWLKDTSQERVLLMEIDGYDSTTSPNVSTRRYSSRTFITGAADTPANAIYRERVMGSPFFDRYIGGDFGGSSFLANGSVLLSNIDGDLDAWLEQSFSGRAVVLRIGSPDWNISQFGTILTGRVDRVLFIADEAIEIFIKDITEDLNKPIIETTFSIGDYSEGLIKPLTFGVCNNVTPVKVELGTSPETFRWYLTDGADTLSTGPSTQLYVDGKASIATVDNHSLKGYFDLNDIDPDGNVTSDVVGITDGASPEGHVDTVGGIITYICGLLGVTVNAASMTALDAAWPHKLGVFIGDRTNAMELIDSLIPDGWYWGSNRDGEIVAGLLTPLVGGEPISLVIDEVETQGEIEVELLSPVFWKVRVGHSKNYTVTNYTDSGLDEKEKERNAAEYKVKSTENASIKTTHANAINPDLLETFITTPADAATEASRILALHGTQRKRVKVSCFAGPFQLEIGDVITLKDSRFGLSAGEDFIVIGISEFYLDNRIDLILWR